MTGIICAGFLFIGCCILLAASINVIFSLVAIIVGIISIFFLLVELLRYYKVHPLFQFHFTALPEDQASADLDEFLSAEPAEAEAGTDDSADA